MPAPLTKRGRLTLTAAAERLGVDRTTLRRWAHDGMVTHYLVGKGQYMEFDPKDIEALDMSFRRERHHPPVE
jgi:excisionase family DNA binding protein